MKRDSKHPRSRSSIHVWMILFLSLLMLSCAGSSSSKAPAPSKDGPPAAATQPETGTPKAAQGQETAAAAVQQGPLSTLPAVPFTIQVGAYSKIKGALDKSRQLQKAGLDAYAYLDTDKLYKVRFDRFETYDEAQRRALELQKKHLIDAFIVVQPAPLIREGDPKSALRQSIVQTASRFLGKPYQWGGTTQKNGFDCSGLTLTVFRLNGLELPRSAAEQYRAGKDIPLDGLEPGDLVFFTTNRAKGINHVGIYSGDGRFIHAPGPGKAITVASLSNSYFKKAYIAACRYF